MAVTQITDTDLQDIRVKKGFAMLSLTIDATAEMVISEEWPIFLLIDPAGGSKTILLPAEANSKDLVFYIFNTADADETLTVEEDSSTTAILVLNQDQGGMFHCDGTTWRGIEASMADVTASAAELNILDGATVTTAELNFLDIATLGTGAASKAVVLDSGDDYTWPSSGILTYGGGALNATGSEINNVADVSARVQELTTSGAVTSGVMSVELNHDSGAIAATIANSNTHQGLFIVKDTSASGSASHTLTLTVGTFNGSNNVATMNLRDEALIVWFDSTGRGTIIENIGGVGLS